METIAEKKKIANEQTAALSETHAVYVVKRALYFTYGIIPIAAGLDKFTNILTNWEQYLSPLALSVIPFDPGAFMVIVGIVEIAAGIIVFSRPVVGGYIVMAWLIAIALNLLFAGYLDIAVRDLAMAVGAFSLAKLSQTYGHS